VQDKAKERAEKVADNVVDMGKKLFNGEGVKKFAAWYIDTSEKVAKDMLDAQAAATEWTKSTALAPIIEAQQDLSSKFIKRTADVARKLWQLES